MTLQKKYVKSIESPIASYDYEDIISGQGYKAFYACGTNTSGANTYILTTDTNLLPKVIAEKAAGLQTVRTYNGTFNAPRTMNGKVYITGSQGVFGAAASNNIYLTMSLYKVSGVTTTQIGSTVKTELTAAGAGETTYTDSFICDVSTGGRIHFKKDDILRLVVNASGSSSFGSYYEGYGVDPNDRNDDATDPKVIDDLQSTQLKVLVPFDIDA